MSTDRPQPAVVGFSAPEGAQTECKNCGEAVTSDFVRVFAGNDNIPQRCWQCASARELQHGAAAGKEVDTDD